MVALIRFAGLKHQLTSDAGKLTTMNALYFWYDLLNVLVLDIYLSAGLSKNSLHFLFLHVSFLM